MVSWIAILIIANLAQSLDHLLDQPIRSRSSGSHADATDASQILGVDFAIGLDQETVLALLLADGEQLNAVR